MVEVENFFKNYYLQEIDITTDKKVCILNALSEEKRKIPENIEKSLITVTLEIEDYPIGITIHLPDDVLSRKRTYAHSNIKQIGCQHVYTHSKMLDSSTSGSSTSTTALDSKDKSKKLKMCQIAKAPNFDGELAKHQKNRTFWKGEHVVVDVLIFLSDSEMGKSIANYLGLIHAEQLILEAEFNNNVDEVLQSSTANEKSKVYRFLQAYIDQKLMFGYSNICLTGNYNIFVKFRANVKSVIFKPSDYIKFSDLPEYSSYKINVKETVNKLECITAIAEIIDSTLSVTAHVEALFCTLENKKNKYYQVKLPLVGIIPFYVIRYFAQHFIRNPKNKSNYKINNI